MTPSPPDPLAPELRARGRRLAIASHPLGMTFQMVFTMTLPTLALVALGASETAIGIQNALVSVFLWLQLPTLRLVARLPKRAILVGAHGVAVAGALPLLAFRQIAGLDGPLGVALALASFGVVAAAINTSNTVWFPLLRGYVEPDRIGTFFGTLRTGWHLTLIGYYLGSQAWLARHPGDFAPLFGAAWLLGLVRIALIARLPERSERTGERIRVREALALAREPAMRRYLLGVAWGQAVRRATIPFALVMLRREVGLSEAEVVTLVAVSFAGGLASLYLSGRWVDRAGSAPVLRWTSVGMGALVLALAAVSEPGTGTLVAVGVFFFLHSAFGEAFGVADTHVLFHLTPSHAPSRALVLASVAVGTAAGLAPALAGVALDAALAGARSPIGVYHAFFLAMATLQALAGTVFRNRFEPRS